MHCQSVHCAVCLVIAWIVHCALCIGQSASCRVSGAKEQTDDALMFMGSCRWALVLCGVGGNGTSSSKEEREKT